ncbi:LysR family transcriptional regulator [Shewanella surugensis]|uniref:LysR family transcriptional regulator n=1 Tax=Shewanella surugensis TaxID=212020 RepID=A0ABT0LDU8_9GAMM|nr:LysR family transcriptional regulator [Shewanella surugensis]MCL1125863.1 LysR family transcriptional regulator [Shewanella surugensis]
MNTDDLDKFLVIAATENLQKAAEILDCNPSMLSKALKRLEHNFNTPLFDRVGKHIRLNMAGRTLQNNAAQITTAVKQTKVDIAHQQVDIAYHVVGPAILLRRWASVINAAIRHDVPQASIKFAHVYEVQALHNIVNGLADLALITEEIRDKVPANLYCQSIGSLKMHLTASHSHPLIKKKISKKNVTGLQDNSGYLIADILSHPFVVPEQSPYCGKTDKTSCDGWNEATYPRRQKMISNDANISASLIHSGQALAYSPDYWIKDQGFIAIKATDANITRTEDVFIVSRNLALIEKCTQG